MKGEPTERHFPRLRDICGIDCTIPKCGTSAFCTGRVTWQLGGRFEVETECPDCRTVGPVWTPATQRLGDALRLASGEAEESLIEQFVASRPAGPHPLRDPSK
jgi:hypothetical protein